MKKTDATHKGKKAVKDKPLEWVGLIEKKLEEMRDNPEHIEIRSKFPFLDKVFMEPIRDVLEDLGMKELVK